MRYLLAEGFPGRSLLVLTPQRTLQEPYREALFQPGFAPGGEVTLGTIGGLARRSVDLFWPLAAEPAGFAHPDHPPVFLTLETAQYYMARIVKPLLEKGYFESVTIDRNRLFSQVLDTLNKSAAIGFPVAEIGQRLDAAWFGDPGQRRVYSDVQECATRFREYCLGHNLLDFSLQLEVFWKYLWSDAHVQAYLTDMHCHLIYDNLEEDIPRSHDLVREWLPAFESALLIYDHAGGYRRFLGADPESGETLREACQEQITLTESRVAPDRILDLDQAIQAAILPGKRLSEGGKTPDSVRILQRPGVENEIPHFYPELLDALVDETSNLIRNGMRPSEIVILAPYLPDALRFSLAHRLEARDIPWQSQRPSRSLREEPASRALLTLAKLAHPGWDRPALKYDVAYALLQAIADLDLVRAQLLADMLYRRKDHSLAPFDGLLAEARERITYTFGTRYDTLRTWLQAYRQGEPYPLDQFLRALFGEVLAQPGFGFHANLDAIRVAGELVESIRKFRLGTASGFESGLQDAGREYLTMVEDGVLAAQFTASWRKQKGPAVLIAPAYTFLLMNQPVSVQFWLNAGSSGWYERLAQPLTHPYVLSRFWEPGRLWVDADEVHYNQLSLARLVSGLLHRCKDRIYLGFSHLGESGFEERGELIQAFQVILMNRESRQPI